MSLTFTTDVKIENIQTTDLEDSNSKIIKKCNFCHKETQIFSHVNRYQFYLAHPNKFFCHFCTRNSYYTKKSRHILIMSMKGIIYYLYTNLYQTRDCKLYVSQIEDMIDTHCQIGLFNPLFSYDPETFNWFIDFNRVGKHGRRMPIYEVNRTISEMMTSFNLYEHIKGFKGHKLLNKFTEATLDFYQRRYRPVGKKILQPTLSGCLDVTNVNKPCYVDCKNFTLADLKISERR